jgi:hypothetical protein
MRFRQPRSPGSAGRSDDGGVGVGYVGRVSSTRPTAFYHFRGADQRLSTGFVVSAVMFTTAQW